MITDKGTWALSRIMPAWAVVNALSLELSEARRLSDYHVRTAFDQLALAAAVLRGVTDARQRFAVDEDARTPHGNAPGVGPTAGAVPAPVAQAYGGLSVDEYVWRAVCGRAFDGVGTTAAAVRIAGAVGSVSDFAGWGHEISVRFVRGHQIRAVMMTRVAVMGTAWDIDRIG